MVQRLALGYIDVRLRPSNGPAPPLPTSSPLHCEPLASPDDRLDQALLELRQAAEAELLELLANVSPGFFETIVLDLTPRRQFVACNNGQRLCRNRPDPATIRARCAPKSHPTVQAVSS